MNFVAQMKKAGLESITECSLLYDNDPVLDVEALLSQMAKSVHREAVKVVSDEASGGSHRVVLRNNGCDITIEKCENTRSRAYYLEALDWPLLHLSFDDAETVVGAHRAQISVSVEEEYDPFSAGLGMRSLGTSFTRNSHAALVTASLCAIARPTAIHWKPCDMLYKPDLFLPQLEIDPVPLFVRVTPFSSNREMDGIRPIGGSTRGAKDLLGLEAVLEEAPVPINWAVSTLHSFISHCLENRGYLPHMTSYSPVDGDIAIVRRMSLTPEIIEEHVSLEVQRAESVGFDTDLAKALRSASHTTPARWDGRERRRRPASAKTFGKRGL